MIVSVRTACVYVASSQDKLQSGDEMTAHSGSLFSLINK